MKQRASKATSGFSILEIVVSITILLLVMAGGIVSYSEFNRKQQVTVAGQDVRQIVIAAQTKARVGEKPAFCNDQPLEGWRVATPSQNSTFIQLFAVCGTETAESVEDRVELDHGLVVSQQLNTTFYTLYGGVSEPVQISIIKPFGAESEPAYVFSIDQAGTLSSGNVTTKEEALASPAPSPQSSSSPSPTESASPSPSQTSTPPPSSTPPTSTPPSSFTPKREDGFGPQQPPPDGCQYEGDILVCYQ